MLTESARNQRVQGVREVREKGEYLIKIEERAWM